MSWGMIIRLVFDQIAPKHKITHQLAVVDVDDGNGAPFVKLDVVGPAQQPHDVRHRRVQERFQC